MDPLELLRQKTINRWARSLFWFNSKFGKAYPEVAELTKFFCANATVIFPEPSSPNSFTGTSLGPLYKAQFNPSGPPILVAPLQKADEKFGLQWANQLRQPAQAIYVPQANMIMLRMEYEESKPILALNLLHEILHCRKATEEGRAGVEHYHTLANMLAEERVVYTEHERHWLRLLNPEAFNHAIAFGLNRIGPSIQSPQWVANPHLIPAPCLDSYTDQLFSRTTVDEYGLARHNSLLLHIHLIACEGCFGHRADLMQEHLIDNVQKKES